LDPVRKTVDPLILDQSKRYIDPRRFIRAVERFVAWSGRTPAELLEMQRLASTSQDEKERFKVTDLAQDYVRSLHGRRAYKQLEYGRIKAWFRGHRRKLPDDYDRDFAAELRSDRPSASTKITLDVLRDVLATVRNDPKKRSMILTQLQTFSGVKELILINRHYGQHVGEKVKAEEPIIELEMKWQRKHHLKAWYTFIGRATTSALKEYFDRERGYPGPDEPIWVSSKDPKKPFSAIAYRQMWMRLLASLGFRPPMKIEGQRRGSWLRYGTGAHEVRTLSISLSQQAVGKTLTPNGRPFNPESAEYFAGHEVDELRYRQLHDLDPDYRREQYRIVEPYLDPYGRREFSAEQEEQMKQMQERLAKLEAVYSEKLKIKERT
jgi:hypothetical protein